MSTSLWPMIRRPLTVAVISSVIFAMFLVAVEVGGGTLGLDEATLRFIQRLDHDRDGISRALARLGARELLIPVGIAAGALLAWSQRSPRPLMGIVGAYLLAVAALSLAKHGLSRPEPFDVPGDKGLSFPSGHVTQAVVIYGGIAMYLSRSVSKQYRRFLWILAGGLNAVVCFVVVYRSAHWLTDVLGSIALGVSSLAVVVVMERIFFESFLRRESVARKLRQS